MIAKEQLQTMSDFEVNKALAELLGHKNCRKNPYSAEKVFFDASESSECESTAANYCNTPNDIMPLAFEHGISVVCQSDKWDAFLYDDASCHYEITNAKPLRAIACCLILVLQEQ